MVKKWHGIKIEWWAMPTIYLCWCAKHTLLITLIIILFISNGAICQEQGQSKQGPRMVPLPRAELKLEEIPFKIIYETYREADGKRNWELFLMNADGSNPVNLTSTPDLDEMYPHVSPDGTKISFVVDEGTGRDKVRSIYYMNLDCRQTSIDGTQRVKVAENARQSCWSFDSKSIAYLKSEYKRYSTKEYATSELLIYDLQTRLHRQHPNKELHHLYAICWSPDGKWFVAAVDGGMGYSDTIIVFEYDGTRVFDLAKWGAKGCRPDFSLDGKKMVWGETDWNLCIGDFDVVFNEPQILNIRELVRCSRKDKVYHVDLSPDGKYIAFSYGPFRGGQQVGGMAPGWDICIGDMSGEWVKVTTDSNHNKEPDWVPIQAATSKQN